ncbi:MAG: hypothetical protein A2289_26235 [Deltaproteobacteria bacterium RIFOXYA12_FULL_58_15]|nr:MAG: hypothetical protein A2289_26235 [Deltaproteobacteria bacterium RIFOXYA12_FULL_58_15]OGR13840.1 MAG: hypothetical protein A2341_01470 [Deltaproteobacteria bacterium RIFOXYB12_FULL_58_9]
MTLRWRVIGISSVTLFGIVAWILTYERWHLLDFVNSSPRILTKVGVQVDIPDKGNLTTGPIGPKNMGKLKFAARMDGRYLVFVDADGTRSWFLCGDEGGYPGERGSMLWLMMATRETRLEVDTDDKNELQITAQMGALEARDEGVRRLPCSRAPADWTPPEPAQN